MKHTDTHPIAIDCQLWSGAFVLCNRDPQMHAYCIHVPWTVQTGVDDRMIFAEFHVAFLSLLMLLLCCCYVSDTGNLKTTFF